MSQVDRLIQILKDHKPHSSYELIKEVYEVRAPSSARLAARIYDLKQRGNVIDSWEDKDNHKIQWYQLISGANTINRWRKKQVA